MDISKQSIDLSNLPSGFERVYLDQTFYLTKGRARCKNGGACTHCCPICCREFSYKDDYVGDKYCDKCKKTTIHYKIGCIVCYYDELSKKEKLEREVAKELETYENSYRDTEGCE